MCSTTRKDDPCGQARAYVEKSLGLGINARALPQAKSHAALNNELGQPGAYTDSVERFLGSGVEQSRREERGTSRGFAPGWRDKGGGHSTGR